MPITSTWHSLPDQNVEVLEMVSKDAHTNSTHARRKLIELAALLMEDAAQHLGRFEQAVGVEVSQVCDRSIKMTVSYVQGPKQGLVSRMVDRRRELMNAAQ